MSLLNTSIRELGEGEWQDMLVEEEDNQEHKLVESQEAAHCHEALIDALDVLNPRERRVLEARLLADVPMTLKGLSAEIGVSGQAATDRIRAPSRSCKPRSRLPMRSANWPGMCWRMNASTVSVGHVYFWRTGMAAFSNTPRRRSGRASPFLRRDGRHKSLLLHRALTFAGNGQLRCKCGKSEEAFRVAQTKLPAISCDPPGGCRCSQACNEYL